MCVGGPGRALSVRYAHGARIMEQFALKTRSWIPKLHAFWKVCTLGLHVRGRGSPLWSGLYDLRIAVGRGEVRAIRV